MVNFLGEFILKLAENIKDIKPDIILILGDRAEMLAAAIVGAYLMIPVAHIHGGDVSSTVDETVRHAITKLSHVHLAATKKAAKRIIKMGEGSWRVHRVGAPGLDKILSKDLISKNEISKKYNLDVSRPVLLVVQHPVTAEVEDAQRQIRETMEAIRELGYQAVVIYPNADTGGRRMIEVIRRYGKRPFIKIYKSIPHEDYLGLMKISSAMIGNSSSGIIEAPSFHLAAVNIGTRQEGRERAKNIIDVDYSKNKIKSAIIKALYDKKFKEKVKRCKSPYGEGKAGERIAVILSGLKINGRLLQKRSVH
jgi:UDP-hydrolysing UDP-N-acetyl-D-glucosamine 2-epimerase